ncbi:MAG: CcmD family protein [Bacteroidota bacterium]
MKKVISLLTILFGLSFNLFAQQMGEANTVEMADQLRADGKIYVVVGVLLIILLGIFVYLVRLDGKISQVEKELK